MKRIFLLFSAMLLLFSFSITSLAATEQSSDSEETTTIDATTFYYDQFDNIAYRNVYDQINNAASNFHNSNTNGEYNDGNYYVAFVLSVSKKDWDVIGDKGLKQVINAVLADHPEYFWMSNDFLYQSSTTESGLTYYLVTIKCYNMYANGTSREVAKNNLNITVGNYATSIDEALPDHIKAYLIHNAIIEDVYFRNDILEKTEENIWAFTADGIFNSKYKSGLSSAYAKAYKAILDELGIPCIYVEGDYVLEDENKDEVSTNIVEAWNEVYLNGNWYIVSLSLDDPETTTGKDVLTYDYFNITSEAASKKPTSLVPDNTWLPGIPECQGTEYSIANIRTELEGSDTWKKSNYNIIDKVFDTYGLSVVLISIGLILILIIALIKHIHKRSSRRRNEKIKNTKTRVIDNTELDSQLRRPPLS